MATKKSNGWKAPTQEEWLDTQISLKQLEFQVKEVERDRLWNHGNQINQVILPGIVAALEKLRKEKDELLGDTDKDTSEEGQSG